MVKIAGVAVLAAILCLLIRQNEKAAALGMSVLGGVVILLLGFGFLQPIWEMVQKLKKLSGLSGDVVRPVFKVLGIGILTQIAGSVCSEAGENTLSKAVEISGAVLSVYVSLPLLTAVLSLIEELIGGSF